MEPVEGHKGLAKAQLHQSEEQFDILKSRFPAEFKAAQVVRKQGDTKAAEVAERARLQTRPRFERALSTEVRSAVRPFFFGARCIPLGHLVEMCCNLILANVRAEPGEAEADLLRGLPGLR